MKMITAGKVRFKFCSLWLVTKLRNGSVLELLNCFLDNTRWNQKPFPWLYLKAKAVLQLQIQSCGSEELVQQTLHPIPIDIGEFESRDDFDTSQEERGVFLGLSNP